MHINNINKLLNLQDINIVKISDVNKNTVEIILEPLNSIQNCPYCNNKNVIRKGHSYLYRFTNASVEGRNNKIKAIQRRHYFTRNRKYYEARIFLECNKRALTA